MKEPTVLLQRLHGLKCQNPSLAPLWFFASEGDMMQSSLAILSFSSSSRHNLCSSSVTDIPHVAPPPCNHTYPLKAQLKVYLPHVFLALLAKYISKVRSPLLLPPWFKPSLPLSRTICKNLQSLCFCSCTPRFVLHTAKSYHVTPLFRTLNQLTILQSQSQSLCHDLQSSTWSGPSVTFLILFFTTLSLAYSGLL